MLEEAIVAKARVWLLPDDHPAAALLLQACGLPCHTWASVVSEAMEDPTLPQEVQEIHKCPLFTLAELNEARSDATVRKAVLKRYQWDIVRPCLMEHDRRVYY